MNDMEEYVALRIQTYDGDIEIPFRCLELVDEFTIRYQNKEELLNVLLAMLNVSIDRKRIKEVYVYYEYIRNGKIRQKNAVVKYRGDNFDRKKLKEFLKDFLKKDHNMIYFCGVRKIRSKGMHAFISGERDIENYEIDFAVEKYFEGAPYGIYRKVYFFLRDNGVKVNINKVVRDGDEVVNRSLSNFHSDDDYVGTLLKLAKNSDDYDRIYDELSKIDLEDLKGVLTNPHFGLFDGIDNDKPYTLEDLYDLQTYTGMDINNLCELAVRSMKKKV